ncbi:MAG: hypothetical protein ACLQUY_27235 [Ktedonobacterales bacterium]
MRYADIVTRALAITWRYKYLWLLALIAGEGAAGFSFSSFSGTSTRSSNAGSLTPAQVWSDITGWAGAHALLLVLAGVAILAVIVAFFLLSAIADGALVRASSEHDWERPFSLGQAWSAGLATFWPVLKVKLLSVVVAIVWIVVIGGIAALAVVSAVGGSTSTTVILAIVGVLLALAAIPFSIVFTVMILLMVREVVLRGRRNTAAALGQTLGLMRRRLGRVTLLWLLSVLLGLATGITMGVVTIASLLVFGGVAAVVYLAGGFTAAIVAGILLAVPWLGIVLVASGAVMAFTSTYWTLGYTRLDLEPLPQYAILPPPAAA